MRGQEGSACASYTDEIITAANGIFSFRGLQVWAGLLEVRYGLVYWRLGMAGLLEVRYVLVYWRLGMDWSIGG